MLIVPYTCGILKLHFAGYSKRFLPTLHVLRRSKWFPILERDQGRSTPESNLQGNQRLLISLSLSAFNMCRMSVTVILCHSHSFLGNFQGLVIILWFQDCHSTYLFLLQILHIREVAEKEWIIFVWDGTDAPSKRIKTKWVNFVHFFFSLVKVEVSKLVKHLELPSCVELNDIQVPWGTSSIVGCYSLVDCCGVCHLLKMNCKL